MKNGDYYEEVETEDSINDSHTENQWKLFSANAKQHSKKFIVVVPEGSEQDAWNRAQDLLVENIPDKFALHHNYPNPFNPVTNIQYDLPQDGSVFLVVYDLLGRQVKTLVNQTETAGYKSVRWDGSDDWGRIVSSGVYFYQLRAGAHIQTRTALLLK